MIIRKCLLPNYRGDGDDYDEKITAWRPAVLIMAVAVTCNPTPLGRIIGITVVTAIKHYFNKKSEVQIPALSNPETVGDRSDKKFKGIIQKRINTNKLNNIGNKE